MQRTQSPVDGESGALARHRYGFAYVMRLVLCNCSQAKSLELRCRVSQGQAVAGGCVNAGAQAGQQRAILIPLVACQGIQHESGALKGF